MLADEPNTKPESQSMMLGLGVAELIRQTARSIRIAPSEPRRAPSRERLICAVLCAEATNSADICLALLKTRKAAILRA